MDPTEKGTQGLLYILLNQLKNLWEKEIKLTTVGKRKENEVFCIKAKVCTVSQVPTRVTSFRSKRPLPHEDK